MNESIRDNISKAPLAWAFFIITLVFHVIWPLTNDVFQSILTTLAVMTLALSSWFSACYSVGVRDALFLLLIVSIVALFIERIGSTTGFPFGDYSYTDSLKPTILGVPVAVVLAWFAMTWVMCVLVQGSSISRTSKAIFVGLLLTAWDFYLDPQMTEVGYWIWNSTSPALPGIPGIPITNYVGWFLSGTLMSFIVLTILKDTKPPRLLAKLILLWTIIGGFILHAVFWKNLSVGLWGLLGMSFLWFRIEKLSRSK